MGKDSITYSIIIPHFDIPDLLMRCLASIPERDDIQVIVVDDGSPDAASYIERYPALSREGIDFIQARHSGPGYARNIGLGKAVGKWLLFSDADDLFTPDAFQIFDSWRDTDADIVYFRPACVKGDDTSVPSSRDSWLGEKYDRGDEKEIRTGHVIPSSKMIKRSLVEGNGFRCEEVNYSSDVVFSVKCGCAAGKVEISDQKVYFLTERQGSLSSNKYILPDVLECRVKEHIKEMRVMKDYGFPNDNFWVSDCLVKLEKMDRKRFKRCVKLARDLHLPVGKWVLKRKCVLLLERLHSCR